ncbi:NAD(P)-binding protein [Sporormia fimetaria CBS 119925]|uniref:NAD(P)-binding protein n=1 Tax=Sporormia fimetaria CBS 119925 TaxID=1340428 RepID=A0A6A6V8Q9_9PLEO|nr:NAD(P)-binding protein [Sporormia fimetaria CBS 119925]
MAPIPFAIIGTNWITRDFIHHAHSTQKWQLRAIYSRSAETAETFQSSLSLPSSTADITIHTSLSALAADPSVSTIYIASPNILHFSHARQMLWAGKNVVIEKPATTTTKQLEELFKIAREKKVVLVEAFRHLHEVNFKKLKEGLSKIGHLHGATLNFCQFSSRYDAVLRGERPNVFSLEFGGGALMDLGVYCVAAAVELFGEPVSSTYFLKIIPETESDGGGMLVLRYKEGMTVSCTFSKMWDSGMGCEVWGEKGGVRVERITDIENVGFWDPRRKVREEIGGEKREGNLVEEAEVFAKLIEEEDWEGVERWERVSLGVVRITEKVRRECGLTFPGDEE